MKLRSLPTIILGAFAILTLAGVFFAGGVNAGGHNLAALITKAAQVLESVTVSAEVVPEPQPAQPVESLAAFTPGNLVINRVGDGSVGLSTAAHPVSLVEFSTSGTPTGNVIAMPTFATANQGGLTDSGSANSHGFLNRSLDGRYLTLIGIDAPIGTVGVATLSGASANRNVARVDFSGAVTIEARLTDAFNGSGGAPRSAFSTDGDDVWIAGNSGSGSAAGLRYVNAEVGTPTSSVQIHNDNLRNTAVFGGILFSSSASAIYSYNAPNNPPTVSTAGSALIIDDTFTANSGSFIFLDRSPTIGAPNLNGLDTLYIAAGTDLKKFEWSGSNWTPRGKGTYGFSIFGLAGIVSGNNVDLFITTGTFASTSTLRKVTDSTGFGGTFTKVSADFALLATAPTNTAFRGIALAPVPPPAPEIAVEDSANIDTGGTSNFGNQTVFTTSSPKAFTIRNTGTADLSITKPFVKDGAHQSEFSVDTTNTVTVVAPNASTTFTVTFTPAGSTTRTAAIHITNNDSNESPFNITLSGTGTEPPQYGLVVNPNGPGTVTSSPTGITCGGDCTENYVDGTLVTLTATPVAGAAFTGWGGDCSGTDPCQVTMSSAKSVTATFTPIVTPVISINDVSQTEGHSGTLNFDFSVSISSPASVGGVTFDVTTASNASALAGTDYDTTSQVGVSIPAGNSGPYTFTVPVKGDRQIEGNETFLVNLSNVSGATAGDLQAIGTIQNDDLPPAISAVSVTKTAGTGTSNSTIANVSDEVDAANTLSVKVNGLASATQNGITVSNISVDNSGVVTADVNAAAGAADAAFTLSVTNSASNSAVSTLQVIVLSPCPDGTWSQQAKKTASDGAGGDQAGASVAISGNTAVVGAPNNDASKGAAYVYVRSSGVWTQQAKLTAADPAGSDQFGVGVAISGDTIIVGAQNSGGKGAAYIFTRSGTVWTQQQKLTASDGGGGDLFGRRVAISGDTAAIGADGNDAPAGDSGAVYVFTRTSGTWTQQQKLTPSDGAGGDRFGFSVGISGDTVVAGAIFDADLGAQSGSAYVFTRSGTTWSQQQKLTASDGLMNDEFGYSVGISGDSVIIGAALDDGAVVNIGSAYVFTRSGNSWSEQQKLIPSDGGGLDLFGFSVRISGNTAVIGSPKSDPVANDAGAAYVFIRSGGVWSQKDKLTASDAALNDQLGSSVGISGDTVIAGAPFDVDVLGSTGSASIFTNNCPPVPAPEIVVESPGDIQTGATINFGAQQFNTTGTPREFTVRNSGTADLTIVRPFARSGDHPDDFLVYDGIATTIPAGQSGTFSISFEPHGFGERKAVVSITNNDGDENPFVLNLVGTGEAAPPATYTWNGTVSGDWSIAANWSPTRVTPSATDTLVIDGNITPAPTITNFGGLVAGAGTGETIARLLITNGADPNFSASISAKTLNIAGNPSGADLDIGAGSNVRLTGAVPVTVNIASGATASIAGSGLTAGSLILEDGDHSLKGSAASAITVGSGGFITTASTYPGSSYPFGDGSPGNGAAGSVVFANGSVYSHNAGNSPFGSPSAAAVAIFQTGSLAQWLTTAGFQASGRTYADLNIGNSTTSVAASLGGSGDFSFNNLKVISPNASNSSLSFIGTGTSSINVRGDIRSEGGFGSAPDAIFLAGPGGQINVIKSSGGTISFNTDGNGHAVDFESDTVIASGTTLSLSRPLQMGIGADRTLVSPVGADVTGGSTGYVIGSLKRSFTAVSNHSETFPIGTVSGYSPLNAAYTVTQAGTYDHTVKANPSKLPGVSGTNALGRYWSLSAVTGPGTATANLTFNYLDIDVTGTEANYKAIRASGGVFTPFTPAMLNTVSNFATVNSAVPSGDWSLAEPTAVEAGSLQFAQAAYSVSEGGGTVTLNVTRAGGSDGAVSIQYATANGGATAGSDYTAKSGTLNWAAGDGSSKSITIDILEDGNPEGAEAFTVSLSTPTGMSTLGAPGSATVTINDNEVPDMILTVTRIGNGTGTVTSSPSGIDCGSDCTEAYFPDQLVTLTATPDAGSKFAGWSGGCTGTSTTCQVTLNISKSVNAQFTKLTISGTVRLQNTLGRTPALADVLVPNVQIEAAGSPTVTGSTGSSGIYSVSGFGSGPYTVTPSINDQVYSAANGITIDDASLIARYVVGLEPGFTVHQVAAADVSGFAGVSSYDATLVARWVVGLLDAGNRSGKYVFTPANVNHGVITSDIVQNYNVLLFGDVDGSFTGATAGPEANLQSGMTEPVAVSVGNAFAQQGTTFSVPLTIKDLKGASVRSYQFDIEYDPTVLQPDAVAADLSDAVSAGMNLIFNVPVPGLLKVAVYDTFGVMGDGVYANLHFTAIGGPGSSSTLAVKGFRFNDGSVGAVTANGAAFVASSTGNSITGRLITSSGQGVRGTMVTLTSTSGAKVTMPSTTLGYFEFGGLGAGQTYTVTVQARRYRFETLTVTASNGLTAVEMIALE